MTGKQYIKALSARLAFRLPGEAAADIIDEISRRFDEGRREGLDESAICAGLGEPSAAAAEFIRECGGREKLSLRSAMAAAVCLLLSAVFMGADIFSAGDRTAPIHFLLPVIPMMIWVICEGKNWRKSLYQAACDRAMAISSLLLTGAAVCCTLLVNETLVSADSLDFLYMCLCTALIIGAMAAWAFTVSRRSEKYMLVFPVLGAGGAILAFAVSFGFFAASRISYINDLSVEAAKENLMKYHVEAGGYFRNFLLLIIVLSAVCFVWAVVKRDRLSLCTLSLLSGCLAGTADIFGFLRRIDPTDAGSPIRISAVPFIFAIACAALWLIVTLIIGKIKSH